MLTQSRTDMYRAAVVPVPSVYRRVLCLGLVSIALVMLIGHVCAVPSAADTAGLPFAEPHHDDTGSVPDSSHASLCAGMVAKAHTSTAYVALQAAAPLSFAFAVVPRVALARLRESTKSRADASPPPLFLLHASFLI